MPFWIFDPNGQPIAAVSEADPDLQRVLAKPQNRIPGWMPTAAQPTPQAATAWAPAAAQAPATSRRPAAAHPASREDGSTVYRVRHVPTGRWLGEGLDPSEEKAPKTWPNRGNAKNAVSHAVRRGLGTQAEYEIVPLSLS